MGGPRLALLLYWLILVTFPNLEVVIHSNSSNSFSNIVVISNTYTNSTVQINDERDLIVQEVSSNG